MLSLFEPPGGKQRINNGLRIVGCDPFHVEGERSLDVGPRKSVCTTKHDGQGAPDIVHVFTHQTQGGVEPS